MASNNNNESAQEQQVPSEQQQLDELDLTPYEEDDDATLHRKLVAAKMARKRAEEDLKLLCNRIGLLKQEEGKAVRKIDETRKRANDIVGQRRRNMDMLANKQRRFEEKMAQQAEMTKMHLYMKEENAHKVNQNKNLAYAKTKQDAVETKQDKHMNRELWLHAKANEESRAHQIKQMTMLQKQESNTKRQMEFIKKQNRTRAQVEEKLNREAYEQNLYESEVARMEREELELINRLKNTKLIEEQAHGQLESAINDPLESQKQLLQGSQSQMNRSSKKQTKQSGFGK